MAIGKDHILTEDTPSELVRVSRLELNKLIDEFDKLITALESVALIGDVATAAATIDTESLQKVKVLLERPSLPSVQ